MPQGPKNHTTGPTRNTHNPGGKRRCEGRPVPEGEKWKGLSLRKNEGAIETVKAGTGYRKEKKVAFPGVLRRGVVREAGQNVPMEGG